MSEETLGGNQGIGKLWRVREHGDHTYVRVKRLLCIKLFKEATQKEYKMMEEVRAVRSSA